MAENSMQNMFVESVASDLPKGVALLADLTTNLNAVRATFDTLMEKIKNEKLRTGQGISLLELKNQSFLAYMTNLACITLRKLKGLAIENDSSIERLVEHRVVLERIRPLEDKLKYQIDKYVKVAAEGVVSIEEPLQLRGDLDNIGSSSDDDDDAEPDQTISTKKKKSDDAKEEVYKIPKVSQAHYDGDEAKDAAKERERRRALNSSMLRDAFHEYTEDPEVVYGADIFKQRSIRKRRELEEYEEERMVRKSMSKKEKAAMRQLPTVGTMGSEILSFSSLNQNFDSTAPAAKRQKTASKSTKGKKGKAVKGKKGFKKRRR